MQHIFKLICLLVLAYLVKGLEEPFDDSMKISHLIRKLSSITLNHHPSKDYRFIKRLGAGARGEVYKCVHKVTGEIRAIKMYTIIEPIHYAYLYDEINIPRTRLFNEPGILKYYEAYLQGHHCWIVMEFVQGKTLEQIPKKKLTPIVLKRILGQLAEIMKTLAKHYLCHRDVRVHNIMLNHEGKLVLIDFSFVCTWKNSVLPVRIRPSFRQNRECNDWKGVVKTMTKLTMENDYNVKEIKSMFCEIMKVNNKCITADHSFFNHPMFKDRKDIIL